MELAEGRADLPVDLIIRPAERSQLLTRDDPVLPGGEIFVVTFPRYTRLSDHEVLIRP